MREGEMDVRLQCSRAYTRKAEMFVLKMINLLFCCTNVRIGSHALCMSMCTGLVAAAFPAWTLELPNCSSSNFAAMWQGHCGGDI